MKKYYETCPQGTPRAVRAQLNIGNVFANLAQCLKCGDVVQSHHRHDMRSCRCGNVYVDGGSWYTKRVAHDFSQVKELSVEYQDDPAPRPIFGESQLTGQEVTA